MKSSNETYVVGRDGFYINIDNSSGGYPYTVNSIIRAHHFKDIGEAKKYIGCFEFTRPEMKIFKVTERPTCLQIEEVVIDDVFESVKSLLKEKGIDANDQEIKSFLGRYR